MQKKILVLVSALLIAAVGLYFSRNVEAETASSMNLLKNVSHEGENLAASNSIRLEVIDMTNETTNEQFQLPALTGNHGVIYIIKPFGDEPENHTVSVIPATGEKIDKETNRVWLLTTNNSYMSGMFSADETNNTWWAINQADMMAL